MKILYVTTIGGTMSFFKSLIKELIDDGHVVDIATNDLISSPPDCYKEWGCRIFSLSCSRDPFNKDNFKAIKQIKELVLKEKYDIVHCHTPIAAMCTRLACRKARKNGTKVFYTVHGFHFYRGASLKNWLLYYPVEKICSYFTDKLITINQEDYMLAKNKFKPKEVLYVPGVGIDLSKFSEVTIEKNTKRNELGISTDVVLFASVGELIERKNHELVLQAMNMIDDDKIHYMIIGKGPLLSFLQDFVKEHKLEHRVHFLGFRTDVIELYKAADVCCLPSFHEGLPVALMEGMASGLPVICSRIRGNTDLINNEGGLLFSPKSVNECRQAIVEILNRDMISMGEINKSNIKNYSIEKIIQLMKSIYEC